MITQFDVDELARILKDCEMASSEAEVMRARIAGKIARHIQQEFTLVGLKFELDKFLDDAGFSMKPKGIQGH